MILLGRSGFKQSPSAIVLKEEKAVYKALDQSLLKDGDVILRKGRSLVSDLIAATFKHSKGMSHCGIVIREGEDLFVIHTISGHISPQEGIRKTPLQDFIVEAAQQKVIILRSQKHIDEEQIKDHCLALYAKRIAFDYDFDATNADKLYCSELVRDIFREAVGEDFFSYTDHYGLSVIDFVTFFDTRYFAAVFQSY